MSYLPSVRHKLNPSSTFQRNGGHSIQRLANGSSGGDNSLESETSIPSLPPLKSSVPSNWEVIEDDFVFFSATLLPHLASDIILDPSGHLGSGDIQLSFVRGGVSRWQVMNMMLNIGYPMEHGPMLEKIKVKAFRLEPLTEGGIITVDGERVEYGTIQAKVMPYTARVMALPQAGRT